MQQAIGKLREVVFELKNQKTFNHAMIIV